MSEMSIRMFDKIGIEVHFIRLIYYTVFDVDLHERYHYSSPFSDYSLMLDLFFLIAIIIPLFILCLRYLTYPVTAGPYLNRYNALLAPLGVIPIFFFRDWDILFMSVLVLLINLWVAWKQLDGGIDEYTWMQFYKDEATYRNLHAKNWASEKIAAETYETLSML